MPIARWPLHSDRPAVQIVLPLPGGSPPVIRRLLADTGAGAAQDPFELVLDEVDCLMCGAKPFKMINLGGAYLGSHPVYLISVEIPSLNFKENVLAVGVAAPPKDFDGIACFRFLNRFTYGNFGDPIQFGLAT